ncbi:MAG: FAD synthase [Candidatus Doudnabacteria bacterium CG10_big_fil_rev_8_21_14_0_10_41_10]|uniref:FAD synthase n=1 Tax=Candidatus Doudnabacteria bacterium CG10_big_fil_rev_8_21_14_0_10_41_10 TaxID=1974551 RepID=A0A2H0VEQ3_9BACT|nr:MAG: FAD synthase [Candidatus Doudnabacteria bacterium CG10_big_fil_rev_8_21_14_0_10_41_10]
MRKKIKVMVYGTFDVLHPGHLDFLRQAKALGDFLVVSVSRDTNAKKFKGHFPIFGEKERLAVIESIKYVDKAVLGDKHYYLKHTLREKPDVIALGYDQRAYGKHLQEDIKSGKLKVKIKRLKAFQANKFKSTVYKKKIKKS